MIRLCTDRTALRQLCADSAFGCPIVSAAEAYGTDQPFAMFWTGEQAAYSKLDGVVRICGTVTDPAETRAFLGAVGAESVVCSAENAQALALRVTERGVVLCKDLPRRAERQAGEIPPLRPVYDVLHACDMVGVFEPFYLDVSHRCRHDTALCTALYDGPKLTAAAIAAYGADCSLITAVAVLPDARRRGLGSAVVRETEERLGGRVYLLRAENENERFYAALGYRPCGAWCAGTL